MGSEAWLSPFLRLGMAGWNGSSRSNSLGTATLMGTELCFVSRKRELPLGDRLYATLHMSMFGFCCL